MIVLDTNVVSEFMGTPPRDEVRRWLNKQDAGNLYFTTVSIAEINFGLEVMPEGRRQHALRAQFERFVEAAFQGRVLPFSIAAANVHGRLAAHRRRLGRPLTMADGQIAAIAASSGFAVATRNLRDFEDCGIALVNPFL